MRLRSAARTHVGLVRANNEDAYLRDDARGLYAVADGMGGHLLGEVASKIAIETLQALAGRPGDDAEILQEAVEAGHEAILDNAWRHSERAGMGTTLTALAIRNGVATIAHVGDSRCYLVRSGGGRQVTTDHAFGGHVLSNCLGSHVGAHRGTDIRTETLSPGDIFILCTDGLSEYVSAEEAARLVAMTRRLSFDALTRVPDRVAQLLMARALKSGGADNITIIVVAVEE